MAFISFEILAKLAYCFVSIQLSIHEYLKKTIKKDLTHLVKFSLVPENLVNSEKMSPHSFETAK